ncbi:cysteine proteinase [Aspergillus heteromorphus CBS 117.55]|uniref:ubiquitinyl hydrolase 1 n=1 Tax=Aspergillus heteromorphus CBS 117.55 TaxID=1448321 RepID=A0A317UV83_9EURO|nr:cysteine proteinase [Aspergillus heteromorphus CBS 117.55]PWY65336.1 cysteine proteinase [Aspergillus heteromorphus CBS 117.55]
MSRSLSMVQPDLPHPKNQQQTNPTIISDWESHFSNHYIQPTRGFKNVVGRKIKGTTTKKGNLSYRNTALTVFLHTPLFLNWLEKYYRAHGRCSRQKRCLLCGFHDLSNAYWGVDPQRTSQVEDIFLPQVWDRIRKTCWKDFSMEEQHDVCEFLGKLFEQLHHEADTEGEQEVKDIFEIRTSNDHTCQTCSYVMEKRPNRKLILVADFGPEKQPGSDRITELLKTSQPKFEANCEQCKKQTVHLPRERITYLPEIFFVQVNRFFSNKKDGTNRLIHPVEVGEQLIIPPEILEGPLKSAEKACYELYAIIWHSGQSTVCGHYTCAVKDPKGQWAYVDDDAVNPNPSTKRIFGHRARQQEAYVLAYRRLPLDRKLQLGPQKLAETQDGSGARPTTDAGIVGSGLPELLPQTDPPDDPLPPPQELAPSLEEPVVDLDQAIEFVGTNLNWSVKEKLALSTGSGPLIQIHGRARIQKAKIQLTLVCEQTGETLTGEGEISLRNPNRKSEKKASSTVMNTRSKKGQEAAPTTSGNVAKPRGRRKKKV